MAPQKTANARHANNAKLMIDNQIVGEAMNVSVQEDTGLDGVYIVGTAYAQEHNHNRVSVSVSISRVVFKKGSLVKYGVGGGNILTLPTFDVHAYDKSDSAMLFKVKDCTMGGRSLNLSANQRIGSDLRCQGILLVATDANGQVVADTDTTDGSGTTFADTGLAPGIPQPPVTT